MTVSLLGHLIRLGLHHGGHDVGDGGDGQGGERVSLRPVARRPWGNGVGRGPGGGQGWEAHSAAATAAAAEEGVLLEGDAHHGGHHLVHLPHDAPVASEEAILVKTRHK